MSLSNIGEKREDNRLSESLFSFLRLLGVLKFLSVNRVAVFVRTADQFQNYCGCFTGMWQVHQPQACAEALW